MRRFNVLQRPLCVYKTHGATGGASRKIEGIPTGPVGLPSERADKWHNWCRNGI